VASGRGHVAWGVVSESHASSRPEANEDMGFDPAVVLMFLDRGLDVDRRTIDGRTALHFAALYGHENILRLLLDFGADVGMRDNDGYTAEDIAKRKCHPDAAKLLAEHAAAVRSKRNNAADL